MLKNSFTCFRDFRFHLSLSRSTQPGQSACCLSVSGMCMSMSRCVCVCVFWTWAVRRVCTAVRVFHACVCVCVCDHTGCYGVQLASEGCVCDCCDGRKPYSRARRPGYVRIHTHTHTCTHTRGQVPVRIVFRVSLCVCVCVMQVSTVWAFPLASWICTVPQQVRDISYLLYRALLTLMCSLLSRATCMRVSVRHVCGHVCVPMQHLQCSQPYLT